MPRTPSTSRWPRRKPATQEGYFFVDNRNPTSDAFDRRGPYAGTIIPAGGQLQVPSTNTRGEPIMVFVDARLWLPLESNVMARSVLTNISLNTSYTVVYAPRWGDQIECFLKRRSPS
jgi:hypothetical protein